MHQHRKGSQTTEKKEEKRRERTNFNDQTGHFVTKFGFICKIFILFELI